MIPEEGTISVLPVVNLNTRTGRRDAVTLHGLIKARSGHSGHGAALHGLTAVRSVRKVHAVGPGGHTPLLRGKNGPRLRLPVNALRHDGVNGTNRLDVR